MDKDEKKKEKRMKTCDAIRKLWTCGDYTLVFYFFVM